VDEVVRDAPEVGRRRVAQPVEAGLGQDRLGPARIRDARIPLHGAVPHEPIDQPGDAAPAEEDLVGQAVHPHPPAGGLGELEEGVVLGQREVVLLAELLVEQPLEAGVGGQEPAPGGDARVARRDVAARVGEAGSHGTP
jgi:hypothetical protein